MPNKLDKLKKILEIMKNDTITPKQVEKFLMTVLQVIKKSKDSFEKLSKDNLKTVNESIAYIEENYSKWNNTQDTRIKSMVSEFGANIALVKGLIAKVKTIKPIDGIDGKDGKDGIGIDGKDGSSDTAEEIADKLETLKGKERLDASAIKNLPEILEGNNQTLAKGRLVKVAVDGSTITGNGTISNPLVATSGSGDMTKAVYDPTTVEGDAFDMDNMVESATSLVMTLAERTAIVVNTNHVSSDGSDHTFINQSVVSGASPTFDAANITGVGFDSFDTDFTDVTGIVDGLFFEKVDFVVVNDTGLQLDVEALGGGDLHAWIGGEKATLDCTTGAGVGGKARIALTEGADENNPVSNYIYLTNAGGTASLNKSTTFPTGAFGWIGHVLVPDATTWTTTGSYTIQRTTESFLNDSRGALSHEREKIRAMGGTYISGVAQTLNITVNGGSADNVHLATTQGVVKQMHDQTFPAFTTGPYYYGNGTNQYTRITDLNSALSDSSGASMSGRRFNLTIWGSVNKTTGESKLFINLPTGTYNKDSKAIADEDNKSDQSIPPAMKGTAFLIARVAMRHTTANSGTWTELGVFSLLGAPIGAQAGGSGSVASFDFDDSVHRIFDNTDPTKEIAHEASAITTGTTRTITMADANVDLAHVNDLPVANLADGIDGELITWSATGVPTTVGVGTSGQVLTSNGAGAAPTFQAGGGGSGTDLDLVAIPSTDHSANGITTNDINAGETVTAMQLVYLHSDGEWHIADASDTSRADGMLAIALEAGTDGNPLHVAMPSSFVRDDTWTWTVGGAIYISETAGALTQTVPTTTDSVFRIIGHATHADRLFFNPEQSVNVNN